MSLRVWSAQAAEQLDFTATFDCVVMINVLEHTWNALHVLQNMHNAVRPGGVLVFSERTYDDKWGAFFSGARQDGQGRQVPLTSRVGGWLIEGGRYAVPFWDVAHAISIKYAVVDILLQHYTPLYTRHFSDQGLYFIGTRK